jgi:cephalosporin hydroxylase
MSLLQKWHELNNKEKSFDPDLHSTLVRYAKECDHITEFGVRWVETTFSFLLGNPSKLISIDIDHPSIHDVGASNLNQAVQYAEEYDIEFSFIQADNLSLDIEPTDLLFIDTEHSYLQLKHELKAHNKNVRKYIIMHDTLTHKFYDSNSYGQTHTLAEIDPGDFNRHGLGLAISEFLEKNKDWRLKEEILTGQGLTILERVNIK